jgi:hypothetical protein
MVCDRGGSNVLESELARGISQVREAVPCNDAQHRNARNDKILPKRKGSSLESIVFFVSNLRLSRFESELVKGRSRAERSRRCMGPPRNAEQSSGHPVHRSMTIIKRFDHEQQMRPAEHASILLTIRVLDAPLRCQ